MYALTKKVPALPVKAVYRPGQNGRMLDYIHNPDGLKPDARPGVTINPIPQPTHFLQSNDWRKDTSSEIGKDSCSRAGARDAGESQPDADEANPIRTLSRALGLSRYDNAVSEKTNVHNGPCGVKSPDLSIQKSERLPYAVDDGVGEMERRHKYLGHVLNVGSRVSSEVEKYSKTNWGPR